MILFLDTISNPCFIGIFDINKKMKDFKSYDITLQESATLLLNIDNLLKKNNLNYFDLENIIVINGPGSFTGIRTTILVANTINFIINKNITGVNYFNMYEKMLKGESVIVKGSSKRDLFIKKSKSLNIEIITNNDFIEYLENTDTKEIYGDLNIDGIKIKHINVSDYENILNKLNLENNKKIFPYYLKKPNIS